MTGEVLTGGVASAALLDHAASGQEYLGEIALGLLGKLSDADLLAEVRNAASQQTSGRRVRRRCCGACCDCPRTRRPPG